MTSYCNSPWSLFHCCGRRRHSEYRNWTSSWCRNVGTGWTDPGERIINCFAIRHTHRTVWSAPVPLLSLSLRGMTLFSIFRSYGVNCFCFRTLISLAVHLYISIFLSDGVSFLLVYFFPVSLSLSIFTDVSFPQFLLYSFSSLDFFLFFRSAFYFTDISQQWKYSVPFFHCFRSP